MWLQLIHQVDVHFRNCLRNLVNELRRTITVQNFYLYMHDRQTSPCPTRRCIRAQNGVHQWFVADIAVVWKLSDVSSLLASRLSTKLMSLHVAMPPKGSCWRIIRFLLCHLSFMQPGFITLFWTARDYKCYLNILEYVDKVERAA